MEPWATSVKLPQARVERTCCEHPKLRRLTSCSSVVPTTRRTPSPIGPTSESPRRSMHASGGLRRAFQGHHTRRRAAPSFWHCRMLPATRSGLRCLQPCQGGLASRSGFSENWGRWFLEPIDHQRQQHRSPSRPKRCIMWKWAPSVGSSPPAQSC